MRRAFVGSAFLVWLVGSAAAAAGEPDSQGRVVDELAAILKEFQGRERRFGGLSDRAAS